MLNRPSRRGFTLLETVVATGMMLIVSGAVYHLLLSTQRLARSQSEHLSMQSTARNAVLLALAELGELNTAEGAGQDRNDILSGSSTSVTYRAGRGFGLLCQPATSGQLRLARNSFVAARDPQPGRDSVSVYLEGDSTTGADDTWLLLGITGVSTAVPCLGSLEPAITLSVPENSGLVGVAPGTPLRISEIMELRLYRSEAMSWLGLRSVSSGEAIQPVAGPLSDDGFRLEYLDRQGHPTADLASTRSISVAIHASPERQPPLGAADTSDVTADFAGVVLLRNAAP
jgi:type II secretory pathway pseudopilin PulG